MGVLETYIHVFGLSLTIVILSGYLIYRYFKKRKK
jgi:hypothetical protein